MTTRRQPPSKKEAALKPGRDAPVRNEKLVRKLRADLKRRGIETEEAGRRAIAAITHLEKSRR